MNKRPYSHVWQHCLKKRAYATWDEAEVAALTTMAESPDDDGPLLAYRCKYKDHWHIGHVIVPKGQPHHKARMARLMA